MEGCSLQAFEDATGLRLTDGDGSLREELPPITTFLNRLLALTIDLQNTLFGVFEDLLRAKIEGAIASGTYDLGVETVTAESLTVTERRTLYVHPQTGAETQVFTITRRDRNKPLTLAEALARANEPSTRLLVNSQSGPRRRAGAGAEPDARRWRRSSAACVCFARWSAPRSRSPRCRRRIGRRRSGPTSPRAWEAEVADGAGVHRQQPPHRHRPVAADLEAPAERVLRVYRLQTDDGERVIGRLVSPAWVAQAAESDAPTLEPGREPVAALLDGRTILQLRGRARASPRQGHGRVPRRALRLHRRHGRPAEGDGSDLRDHLLEAAPVRADGRERPRDPRRR